MNRKFKMATLCASIMLITQGCGSSEDDEVVSTTNSAPVITVSSSDNVVDEGAELEIPFNVIDAEDLYSALLFSLDVSSTEGSVSIDKDEKVVRYQAPWLTSDSSLNDGFSLIVRDTQGSKSEVVVSVVVNDLDEPVEVVALPPTQAFGYESTQTDTYLEMYVYEGETDVVFKYNITETDADEVEVSDIEVESPLYNNFITQEATADGMTLTLDIPEITTASSDTEISFTVSDGDSSGSIAVKALLTIINKVELAWTSAPSKVLESTGAAFVFETSEDDSYQATYSAEVTYANGDPLDFDLPYSLSDQTVTFDVSDGFQGDKNLLLTVTVQNTISGVPQDDFIESTVLSQTFTAVDDRDDGFTESSATFDTNKSLFTSYSSREDDVRVASALSKLWMLKSKMTNSERSELLSNASALMDEEITALDASIETIEALLAEGESDSTVTTAMSEFDADLHQLGKSVRDLLVSTEVAIKDTGATVTFKAPSDLSDSQTINTYLSHYVGNTKYGYYDGTETWVFSPSYKYLDVVNVFDDYCFD